MGTAARYTYGLSQTVLFTATVPPTLTHQAFLPLVARSWTPGPAYPAAPAYPTTGQPFAVLSTTAGFRATYDANGSLLTRTVASVTTTLAYNAENRVVRITQGLTMTMYAYDGDGAKVWEAQQVGATTPVTTVFLGAVEIILSPTARITRTYYLVHGQRIALREQRSDGLLVYFLHGDQLGSASLVTGLTGTVLSSRRYTPYGLPRSEAGSLPTPYRYTGQRDTGVGFYDYQARLYDPAVGRFVQADTLVPEAGNPQSLNRYGYALDNPVKYNDPSGHDVVCAGRDASTCGTPSPLLEFYGPNWDFQEEPGPDELWAWFAAHPGYDPATDPVMQDPAAYGVVYHPGIREVRERYAWYRLIQTRKIDAAIWQGGEPAAEAGIGLAWGIIGASGQASEAKAWLQAVPPKYRESVELSFVDGTVKSTVLSEDMIVYRHWGKDAPETGSPWYSPKPYTRPGNARRYLALPPSNSAENVSVFKIPAGTTVVYGKVARQPGFGPYATGNGMQIYLPNPAEAILLGPLNISSR